MPFKLAQTEFLTSTAESARHTISKPNIFTTAKAPEEWVPFVVMDGMAVLRLSGHYLLDDAVRFTKATILAAKAHHIADVLVVATNISGFDPPSVSARHAMVRELASAANGSVRLAAVLRREMIDPHKFGVVAAKNFGFTMDVFACEREAIAWLRGERVSID